MDDNNKTKQTMMPNDGHDTSDDTATTPVDNRNEQEKELERIESIEASHISQNTSQIKNDNAGSLDGMRTGANQKKQDAVADTSDTATEKMTDAGKDEEHPALLAARQKAKNTKKRNGHKRIGFALLIVLLLAAIAAAGWFFYQDMQAQQRVSQVESDLATKELALAELTVLNEKLSALADDAKQDENDNQGQAVEEYRQIPEWNVRYKVTDENKDLSYGVVMVGDGRESIGLLSLEVTREAGVNQETQELKCGIGSIGMITRMNEEQMKEFSQGSDIESSKIGEYHYVYISPQNTCAESLATESLAAKSDAVKAVVQSLESQQ